MSRVRTPVVVGLIAALAGALGYYAYRDRTAWHEPYRFVRAVTPCDPADAERRVFATPEGKFCLEPDSKDTIKQTLQKGHVWEPELVEVFRRQVHAGDTVVDAGAFIGEHTKQLAKLVGPSGRVIAFEPQLRIYEELLVNLDLDGVTNVRAEFAALGDKLDRVSMGAARDDNEGATAIGTRSDQNNRVELRTLDSYALPKIAFMKIDVEGFERQVLEGARQTIARDHPTMVIEVWPEHRAAVLPLLDQLGYTTTAVTTVDVLATPRP